MKLGVNIDHIAVLREARAINDPSPLDAISICKVNKTDQITIHLREDRRHIHDDDVKAIIKHSTLPINLECSINEEIIKIACKLKPARVTLVPENRAEVTTEGGLDLKSNFQRIQKTVQKLHKAEIEVSLFIDPNKDMIELSQQLQVQWIELHTGLYANIYAMLHGNLKNSHHCIKELDLSREKLSSMLKKAIQELTKASLQAHKLELKVAAGHGLNYQNVQIISRLEHIEELNIGQSIIARSVFTGLAKAILDMKELISE